MVPLQFQAETPTARRLPPVLLLGGEANALSVARDLSKLGVRVYAVGEPESAVRHSRHVRWIIPASNGGAENSWAAFLLGAKSNYLRGAVVLSCCDAGLQVLIRHRDELLHKFILDQMVPAAQAMMLDKLATCRAAREAGVALPGFWEIARREQILELQNQFVYPLLVKPRLSHVFEAKFGRKHVTANDFAELMTAFNAANEAGVDMLLTELIPGGDHQLCSYFTYLDEGGRPLFHFTKRVIRRFPAGMGAACYHITDWVPQILEPSLKLLGHVGLRGIANVEFKIDPRDGVPKLIECNARFVASNALVSGSGCALAALVYNRLIGRPVTSMESFRWGMRQWDPIRDFRSFRELRHRGDITLGQWLASIMHSQSWPYFRWSDPGPTLGRFAKPLLRRFISTT